jgi:hypothetical protein
VLYLLNWYDYTSLVAVPRRAPYGGDTPEFILLFWKITCTARARGSRVRARASREGLWDESTVNNSGSKLKIQLTGPLEGIFCCFVRSMGRGTHESKYRRRKVVNNNCTKTRHLVAYRPCSHAGCILVSTHSDEKVVIAELQISGHGNLPPNLLTVLHDITREHPIGGISGSFDPRLPYTCSSHREL